MEDEKNNKIIDIFAKSQKNENNEKLRFFKGFQYVKITKDENGNYFKEDSIREYVSKCFYIISVMKKNGIGTAIYKYKVPYMSLLDFIDKFKINKDYGEIIDIERYIPEDSA